MKYYEHFLKKGCFRFEEAIEFVGNEAPAKTLLKQYSDGRYITNDDFFVICKKRFRKSSRYLMRKTDRQQMRFIKEWNLTVPVYLMERTMNVGDENADKALANKMKR